jgi:hypothetical protein
MLFNNTIFDNRISSKQTHSFQYLVPILLPLNTNTERTINMWERLIKILSDTDAGSMWHIDME